MRSYGNIPSAGLGVLGDEIVSLKESRSLLLQWLRQDTAGSENGSADEMVVSQRSSWHVCPCRITEPQPRG